MAAPIVVVRLTEEKSVKDVAFLVVYQALDLWYHGSYGADFLEQFAQWLARLENGVTEEAMCSMLPLRMTVRGFVRRAPSLWTLLGDDRVMYGDRVAILEEERDDDGHVRGVVSRWWLVALDGATSGSSMVLSFYATRDQLANRRSLRGRLMMELQNMLFRGRDPAIRLSVYSW